MNILFSGLRRFSERVFPKHQEHFQALSQGQKPHTLLITCSDSRIDPNMVTQTKPGDIFIVRNPGNIIPPFGASSSGEQAAIEFAVEALAVSNIVICGHSQCGAMNAILNSEGLEKMPSVEKWLVYADGTKRRIEGLEPKPNSTQVAEENVLMQAQNLRTHPSVSAALRAGTVQIFGWVYSFESGTVSIYDRQKKKYVPSTEIHDEDDVSRFAL